MATTSYGTPYVEAADLVSGYPGTSLSLADRVDDISFKGNGINNQTGTTYTLDILDAGKTVTLSNSSAVTVTIPTNTAEAIEIGSIVRFNNKGAGTVTIQPDGGVTLNGGNISLAQNAAAQIVKLDTNTWGAIDSLGSAPGLALINPTSIANSGGSASASGGAVTFSGVSSVSLNGVFSSTYAHYMMTYSLTASTGVNLYFRLRLSGTDTTSGYYYRSGELGATYSSSGGSSTYLYGGYGRSTVNAYVGQVFNPNVAEGTQMQAFGRDSSGTTAVILAASQIDNTTQYDGITLLSSTGNITGTIRVYGYKN